MFCIRCGAQMDDSSVFCSKCGTQVAPVAAPAPAEDVSPKSRLAATLLAVFLGWAGAHRFYMGKTWTAVGMLLLGAAAWGCYAAYMVGVVAYASEWEDTEAVPVWFLFFSLGGLLGVAVGIWALVDFIIAVTGNFKDREGRPITKW